MFRVWLLPGKNSHFQVSPTSSCHLAAQALGLFTSAPNRGLFPTLEDDRPVAHSQLRSRYDLSTFPER